MPAQDSLDRVRQIARKLARRLPRTVDFEELVSAGAVGLAEALSRRDEQQADRFDAFAEFRIRGAMLDYLRQLDHLSRGARRVARALAAAERQIEATHGRALSELERREAVGTAPAAVVAFATRAATAASVDIDVAERTDPEAFHSETAEEALLLRESLGQLKEAIKRLPTREAEAMRLLYDRGLTLKDAGKRLGVTESRACQLRGEAIRHLREQLAA